MSPDEMDVPFTRMRIVSSTVDKTATARVVSGSVSPVRLNVRVFVRSTPASTLGWENVPPPETLTATAGSPFRSTVGATLVTVPLTVAVEVPPLASAIV